MSRPTSLSLPTGVAARRLPVDDGELAALEAGTAGPRGSALLVPGFTGSKEDFLPLLPLLAADGWHVVAVDQRGQYESSHAPDPAYSIDRLAADVVQVARSLDRPVHLLGHSFGGLVATAAAATAPETFASVTLLCSGAGPIPEPQNAHLRTLLAALDVMDLASIHAAMRELDGERGRPATAPEIDAFLERRFLRNDPNSLRRIAEHLVSSPDRVDDLGAALRQAGVPSLVARGEQDDAWPHALQERIAERLGARYAVIAGAAHSPAIEQPMATAALLSGFWSA